MTQHSPAAPLSAPRDESLCALCGLDPAPPAFWSPFERPVQESNLAAVGIEFVFCPGCWALLKPDARALLVRLSAAVRRQISTAIALAAAPPVAIQPGDVTGPR